MNVIGRQIVATRGVADKIEQDSKFALFVSNSVKKFMSHDWGQTAEDSVERNNLAVNGGEADQIFASYELNDWKIWIITEWDGSVTTILFPEEY